MREKTSVTISGGAPGPGLVAVARSGFWGGLRLAGPWQAALAWIIRAIERRRQRRDLATLTPWELKDIGLTQEQARQESAKPFWRA